MEPVSTEVNQNAFSTITSIFPMHHYKFKMIHVFVLQLTIYHWNSSIQTSFETSCLNVVFKLFSNSIHSNAIDWKVNTFNKLSKFWKIIGCRHGRLLIKTGMNATKNSDIALSQIHCILSIVFAWVIESHSKLAVMYKWFSLSYRPNIHNTRSINLQLSCISSNKMHDKI